MKLMTKAIEKRLIINAQMNSNREKSIDHKPVLKLFGGSACTWLLTEYAETDGEGYFFGLCDLGLGLPELGYVSRKELESIRFPPFGLPIERDRHFKANKTLSEYAEEAKAAGRIKA
jgi:hypothetical protein